MSIVARQSTALETAIGPVLDADGVAVTDCVVGDFKIKKTTGNFAALNGSATLTHVFAGMYDLVLTTSDTDTVGLCCIAIDDTVNACAPLFLQVMEEAVYDALYAASANAWSGAAGSSIGTANMTQISGDSAAADNLERWFDGTVGFATSGSDLAIGAFSMTTLTASGAVAFQSTFGITGATTFTGAITATDSSNQIGGCQLGNFNHTGTSFVLSGSSASGVFRVVNSNGPAIVGTGTSFGMALTATAGTGFRAVGTTAGGIFFGSTTNADGVIFQSGGGTGTDVALDGDTNITGNLTGSIGSVGTDGISAASLAADAGIEISTAVWASATRTLTAIDEDSTTLDLDATIRAAVGLASANLDTQLTAIDDYLDTEVAAILAAVDTEIGAIQTTLAALFTTALTESYRADGATGSVAQLLYEINQTIGERSISGTTATVKKIDGSTTALTQTLDADPPTSITRAS